MLLAQNYVFNNKIELVFSLFFCLWEIVMKEPLEARQSSTITQLTLQTSKIQEYM